MTREWFELTVEVPSEHADTVASFLFDHGSTGLEQEDRPDTAVLRAYFAAAPPQEELRRLCNGLAADRTRLTNVPLSVRRVPETDWAHHWRQEFHGMCVGETLYVGPTWDASAPPGRTAIVIDPGMAFGTGHHASTRGCLRSIETAVREIRVRRALDVGTGSGILAIALARLGAGEVLAIDNDPIALEVARENAERNGVAARIEFAAALPGAAGAFDLIAANLYTNLLVALAPDLRALLCRGGILTCAGFLAEDADAVAAAYTDRGFRVRQCLPEDDWVTLSLRLEDAG